LPRTPDDSRFLKACRSEPSDVTPVWFMRQAGRYLPEYRSLRQKHSLLELCHKPELAAQVTLQPVERLGGRWDWVSRSQRGKGRRSPGLSGR